MFDWITPIVAFSTRGQDVIVSVDEWPACYTFMRQNGIKWWAAQDNGSTVIFKVKSEDAGRVHSR